MTNLIPSSGPALEPVTVQELKDHAKLDTNGHEPAPGAPTVALAGAGAGNLSNGVYRWRVTVVTADGESEAGAISDAVTVADNSADGKGALTNIPLGGAAVTSRRLWRTKADGSTYFLLATLADNTTTSYTDNVADASLGAEAPSSNTTADPYLNRLITAARMDVEEELNRKLITQTWQMTADGWPVERDGRIHLPFPPCQSVTSIAYVDSAGDSQTWASSQYQVDKPSGHFAGPARIQPVYGVTWPSLYSRMAAVTITFVCGYGSTRADVPAMVRQEILMRAAELYDHRRMAGTGPAHPAPYSMGLAIQPYRIHSF